MDDLRTLRWEQADEVVTITLDRPERKNAISWRMFEELGAVFSEAGERDDVRCVVITGAGDAFCSGADLSDPANVVSTAFEFEQRMRKIDAIVRAVVNCTKPTIAKVTGIAAGAGCNLALACDLIVASTDASFAELFVKRGLVVDFGGSWTLTRLLPLNRAKELAMLGETIDARRADGLGLVNRLCERDEIDQVVAELAARLVALPPGALRLIKQNLNRATERSLESNLVAESAAQTICFNSEDLREAIAAFLEKREPHFTGR